MNKSARKIWAPLLAVCAALAAGQALAQWQWIDADGRKIFSDKAPPPSVPDNQILRGGDGRPYMPVGKAIKEEKAPTYGFEEYKPEAAPSPAPKAAAGKKEATKTPKELEQEKKAQAEQAAKEAEAKRKEQERKEANCKIMRSNLASLDSGRRIGTVNDKGERAIMGDAERASERKRVQDSMKESGC